MKPLFDVTEAEAEVSTLKVGEKSELTHAGLATIEKAYKWPRSRNVTSETSALLQSTKRDDG